jgi:hypothetical protein
MALQPFRISVHRHERHRNERYPLLYVPKTSSTPAPVFLLSTAILIRETQDGFASEFARRGYVVPVA